MSTKIGVGLQRPDSPYTDQECEEIIDKLEQWLDGELDADKEQEFIDKVNNCEYCLEQIKVEKSLREAIKSGYRNMTMSTGLIGSIKSRIQNFRTGKSLLTFF